MRISGGSRLKVPYGDGGEEGGTNGNRAPRTRDIFLALLFAGPSKALFLCPARRTRGILSFQLAEERGRPFMLSET